MRERHDYGSGSKPYTEPKPLSIQAKGESGPTRRLRAKTTQEAQLLLCDNEVNECQTGGENARTNDYGTNHIKTQLNPGADKTQKQATCKKRETRTKQLRDKNTQRENNVSGRRGEGQNETIVVQNKLGKALYDKPRTYSEQKHAQLHLQTITDKNRRLATYRDKGNTAATKQTTSNMAITYRSKLSKII